MKVINCIQGSSEWLQERAGRVTASRCAAVMATLKSGKESAERANYRIEVVTERLTAMATETFVSDDMRRGIEFEPLARTAYEFAADVDVQRIGMAIHLDIEDFSASPDGLVGDAGAIEIKCPRRTNHVRWSLAGQVPEEHIWQCYAVMDVCEREWVDFVSYCPDMPKHMQVFSVRLHRDELEIKKMRAGVLQFLDEVQATVEDMEKIFGKAPSPRSAPDKSVLESQLEASLGITNADIEAVMRQQAERIFDQP
jgi:putative phage-type endonuclease